VGGIQLNGETNSFRVVETVKIFIWKTFQPLTKEAVGGTKFQSSLKIRQRNEIVTCCLSTPKISSTNTQFSLDHQKTFQSSPENQIQLKGSFFTKLSFYLSKKYNFLVILIPNSFECCRYVKTFKAHLGRNCAFLSLS
jgi:hypothetical protein